MLLRFGFARLRRFWLGLGPWDGQIRPGDRGDSHMDKPYVEPEELTVPTAVLQRACLDMGVVDNGQREIIAVRIIRLTQTGEWDSNMPEKRRNETHLEVRSASKNDQHRPTYQDGVEQFASRSWLRRRFSNLFRCSITTCESGIRWTKPMNIPPKASLMTRHCYLILVA